MLKILPKSLVRCLLAMLVCLALATALQAADPLPSWQDTGAKSAILQFVAKVT